MSVQVLPCSAGKVNLMAHAKRSTNRDFKLNKRPPQRNASVGGARGVDPFLPSEVRSEQPQMGFHPACTAAAVAGPSARSELICPANK